MSNPSPGKIDSNMSEEGTKALRHEGTKGVAEAIFAYIEKDAVGKSKHELVTPPQDLKTLEGFALLCQVDQGGAEPA